MVKKIKNIKKDDWRLQAITRLTKKWKSPYSSIRHDKGAKVKLVASLDYNKYVIIFGIPNSSALLLDISYKLWAESQKKLKNLKMFIEIRKDHLPKNIYYPKDESILFDAIEKRMASVVFAHTALEAFANEVIPDNHIYSVQRDDRKCTENYNKSQIENYISLETKIGNIVPKILNIDTPKGIAIWEKFLDLRSLRDRIIHPKTKDRKSTGPKDDTIWRQLLIRKFPDYSLIAKNIIGFLLQNTAKKPRWFNEFVERKNQIENERSK